MTRLRHITAPPAALAVALALTVGACGDDGDSTAEPQAESTPPASSGPPPEEDADRPHRRNGDDSDREPRAGEHEEPRERQPAEPANLGERPDSFAEGFQEYRRLQAQLNEGGEAARDARRRIAQLRAQFRQAVESGAFQKQQAQAQQQREEREEELEERQEERG